MVYLAGKPSPALSHQSSIACQESQNLPHPIPPTASQALRRALLRTLARCAIRCVPQALGRSVLYTLRGCLCREVLPGVCQSIRARVGRLVSRRLARVLSGSVIRGLSRALCRSVRPSLCRTLCRCPGCRLPIPLAKTRWGIGREAIPGVIFDVTIEFLIEMLFVLTIGCSTGWTTCGSTGPTIERTIE
jgi:hypothetical protein